ncbi:unnamed protein product, partial [Didymodactylos carnosus]
LSALEQYQLEHLIDDLFELLSIRESMTIPLRLFSIFYQGIYSESFHIANFGQFQTFDEALEYMKEFFEVVEDVNGGLLLRFCGEQVYYSLYQRFYTCSIFISGRSDILFDDVVDEIKLKSVANAYDIDVENGFRQILFNANDSAKRRGLKPLTLLYKDSSYPSIAQCDLSLYNSKTHLDYEKYILCHLMMCIELPKRYTDLCSVMYVEYDLTLKDEIIHEAVLVKWMTVIRDDIEYSRLFLFSRWLAILINDNLRQSITTTVEMARHAYLKSINLDFHPQLDFQQPTFLSMIKNLQEIFSFSDKKELYFTQQFLDFTTRSYKIPEDHTMW